MSSIKNHPFNCTAPPAVFFYFFFFILTDSIYSKTSAIHYCLLFSEVKEFQEFLIMHTHIHTHAYTCIQTYIQTWWLCKPSLAEELPATVASTLRPEGDHCVIGNVTWSPPPPLSYGVEKRWDHRNCVNFCDPASSQHHNSEGGVHVKKIVTRPNHNYVL